MLSERVLSVLAVLGVLAQVAALILGVLGFDWRWCLGGTTVAVAGVSALCLLAVTRRYETYPLAFLGLQAFALATGAWVLVGGSWPAFILCALGFALDALVLGLYAIISIGLRGWNGR